VKPDERILAKKIRQVQQRLDVRNDAIAAPRPAVPRSGLVRCLC